MASKMAEADYRYLLVTQFESRTVSYETSAPPLKGKNEDP